MTVKATTVRSLSTSSTGATVIEVPMVAAASSRVSHSDSEGDDLSEGDVTGSLGKFRKLKHLLHHFGALLAMSEQSQTTPLAAGLRVIRGPDWKWGDQDGGEGFVGTVKGIGGQASSASPTMPCASTFPQNTVMLQWDNGMKTNYRAGRDSAYDLRVLDSGPVGTRHMGVTCSHCKTADFFGLRWKCFRCTSVNLCSACYMSDRHDVGHQFRRFDVDGGPGNVVVPPRRESRKLNVRGIFIGAHVTRSGDWRWEDQDGGAGSSGQVVSVEGWQESTGRSIIKVLWSTNGETYHYRLGHKGKVDLKFVPGKETSGGTCYPDHLPILGKVEASSLFYGAVPATAPQPQKKEPPKVGEKVRIGVSLEALQRLQEGHNGFTPKMADAMGKVGKVHRITSNGDVRVQYPGKPEEHFRWTFNPEALQTVVTFHVGDEVRLSESESEVRALQAGHGEWADNLRMALGRTGKVVKIYSDGDVRVQVAGQTFTLNPNILTLFKSAAGAGAEANDDMRGAAAAVEDMRLLSPKRSPKSGEKFLHGCSVGNEDLVRRMLDQNAGALGSKLIGKGVQVAAKNGRLAVVKAIVGRFGDSVHSKCGGKTALQVAIHDGHLEVADLLLSSGADISVVDDEGDQAVHYAVLGNQPTCLEYLVERGADPSAANGKGCSPLALSCLVNSEECAHVLIKHRADVNAQDEYGDTPLHEAIGKRSDAMVAILCAVPGIDFDRRNRNGFGPIHFAAKKGNASAVRAMMETEPGIAEKEKQDGYTALHLSALNGKVDVVKVLLAGGCRTDAQDCSGQTPLHVAAAQGYYHILELLLHNCSQPINVDRKDAQGNTALHIALSRKGEAASTTSISADSPLHINEAIFNKVKKAGVPEPLQRWMSLGLLLVLNGADPCAKNTRGHSCYDRVDDPPSRALLVEESVSSEARNREGAAAAPRPLQPSAIPARKPIECKVCSDPTPDPVTFLPCRHRAVCSGCAERMKKCIECQAVIEEKLVSLSPEEEQQASSASNSVTADDDDELSEQSSPTVRNLKAKVQDYEDQFLCGICMERKKNVAFLCGHGTCAECVETIRMCHMCRGPVTKKIHLY